MKNIDIFTEFTFRVLSDLYVSFPVPVRIDVDNYAGEVIAYPDAPQFPSHGLYPGGVLITDEVECKKTKIEPPANDFPGFAFQESDWSDCIIPVEEYVGRKLNEDEINGLIRYGVRPYTTSEYKQIQEWKDECNSRNETSEERRLKASIFVSSVQFLVKEGFVRYMDLPTRVNAIECPQDVLVNNSLPQLRFTLTSKGIMQLNKKDPVGGGQSLFIRIGNHIKDNSTSAIMATGADVLLTSLIS
jgi:hypothetical protein